MLWSQPRFHRNDVDLAGRILRGEIASADVVWAYEVLDNWRASHAFPLNTFQVLLRRRAREVDRRAFVAQRLKRVPSIMKKLEKQRSMRLSQMQDVGGCRAVVRSADQAAELRQLYRERVARTALYVGEKDYIATPRESGYRSYHLVFKYKSARSGPLSVWDGLQVEIQIRSQLQHAWATAVETVGTLIGQALKSSEGEQEWLELFKHISSIFAHVEGAPPVAGAPTLPQLFKTVRSGARQLRMRERLVSFRNALRVLEDTRPRTARYFLLRLNPAEELLEIMSFRENEIEQATEQYEAAERAAKGQSVDVVLVRADSIDNLKRAYPNYFLDTQHFLEMLEEIMRPPTKAG